MDQSKSDQPGSSANRTLASQSQSSILSNSSESPAVQDTGTSQADDRTSGSGVQESETSPAGEGEISKGESVDEDATKPPSTRLSAHHAIYENQQTKPKLSKVLNDRGKESFDKPGTSASSLISDDAVEQNLARKKVKELRGAGPGFQGDDRAPDSCVQGSETSPAREGERSERGSVDEDDAKMPSARLSAHHAIYENQLTKSKLSRMLNVEFDRPGTSASSRSSDDAVKQNRVRKKVKQLGGRDPDPKADDGASGSGVQSSETSPAGKGECFEGRSFDDDDEPDTSTSSLALSRRT